MRVFGLIAAVLTIAGTCQADAILGNLPGSGTYTGDVATLSSTTWVAAGVSIGGVEEQFTSLEGYIFNAFDDTATLGGWIETDSSGSPGSVVGTFNSLSLPADSGATELTFTTTATVDLQANTTYWFVIEDAAGVGWRSDSSNSSAGTAPAAENGSGATFVGYKNTNNSGTTWNALSPGNPTIEIDATSIGSPEPGSVFLLVSGCACLMLRRGIRLVR